MERKGKRRYRTSLLLFSLCALAVFIWAGTLGTDRGDENGPRANPSGETRLEEPPAREPAGGGEPASIEELQAAVERAAALARDGEWPGAGEAAREIRERWVSFKPAMRANAGERMWQTTDVNAFEAALNQFEAHTAARDQVEALESAEAMLGIIEGYRDDRDLLAGRSDGSRFTDDPSPMP